jgi:hypothetical protein
MTKRVRRKPNACDAQLLPEYTEIPFKVADGEVCVVLGPKHCDEASLVHIPPKMFAKLGTEGYKAMSISFPKNFEDEIIKVTISFRKSKHLTRPKPAVKNSKRNKMGAAHVCTCGAETYHAMFCPLSESL